MAAQSDAEDMALNLGTGVSTSLLELCSRLCQEAGRGGITPQHLPARAVNPVTRRQADVTRTAQAIGFRAKTSLNDGLRALTQWHAAQNAGQIGSVA
jgi:UDP-glucose 4-epimerase